MLGGYYDGFFKTLFNLKSYTCRHRRTFSGSMSTGGILRLGYGSSGSGITCFRKKLYFVLATSAMNLWKSLISCICPPLTWVSKAD